MKLWFHRLMCALGVHDFGPTDRWFVCRWCETARHVEVER